MISVFPVALCLGAANGYLGDWEIFVASVASDPVRDALIEDLATWINETATNFPLTDLYDTVSGE